MSEDDYTEVGSDKHAMMREALVLAGISDDDDALVELINGMDELTKTAVLMNSVGFICGMIEALCERSGSDPLEVVIGLGKGKW